MKTFDVTSIILAGGKSLRMGKDKALIKIDDKPLIQHIYEVLKPISSNILISSNSNDYSFLHANIVKDEYKNIGPISGIYSCLKASKTVNNIIVSCDTPFLTSHLFLYLLRLSNGFDITNPIHEGITEPIIGIYKKKTYLVFKHFIEKGVYSPARVINTLNHQHVEISEKQRFYNKKLFYNLNTKKDLDKLIKS